MQAPNAVCKNITVNLSPAGTVTVTSADINGGTTDNCTASPTLAPASTSYTCADLGANNITMTATDAAGNTATCVATVTVRDVTAPVITTCPASATINANANCAGSYTPVAPVATDNCTATTWTVSQNGASLPVGATTFVYTVTDGSGNTATCAQVITVVDVTKPTIACPANISVGVDVNLCTAVVTYSIPAAFDNCAASSVARTLGYASGAAFPVGITVN
ncbi:MAG: HYR domain-containing protein, partial [Bacteroidota bacterium]